MQVPLLHPHTIFHTVLVRNSLSLLSVSIHYSSYKPGHRNVKKESKKSYGKHFPLYVWYLQWINIGSKLYRNTQTSWNFKQLYSHLFFQRFPILLIHLLVCSMLHISSYFFLSTAICIYATLFLLENYHLLTYMYSVAFMKNKKMLLWDYIKMQDSLLIKPL